MSPPFRSQCPSKESNYLPYTHINSYHQSRHINCIMRGKERETETATESWRGVFEVDGQERQRPPPPLVSKALRVCSYGWWQETNAKQTDLYGVGETDRYMEKRMECFLVSTCLGCQPCFSWASGRGGGSKFRHTSYLFSFHNGPRAIAQNHAFLPCGAATTRAVTDSLPALRPLLAASGAAPAGSGVKT